MAEERFEQLAEDVVLTAEDAVELQNEVGADGDYPNTGFGASKSRLTINTYADLVVFEKLAFRSGTVAAVNTGANGAQARFLGSLDNGKTFDVVLATDVAVPAGSSTHVNTGNGSHFSHIKVQVRSAVAGAATTVVGKGAFTD